jgi:uncharacterized protein (TIGR00369 family)
MSSPKHSLGFEPKDHNFEQRVRESFSRQALMQTIGATMTRVEPGVVEIRMPYNESLTQQNGFIHGGIITSIVDSACGYAALSLTPENTDVLAVEFKINLVNPARGHEFVATAHVLKAGKNLTFCEGKVVALAEGHAPKLVAAMLSTIMSRSAEPLSRL